ncbi:Transglycosylase-associated protein [Catenulispora acidiphila DSM 44928]|uniref:Transglycosylase-associated protein n=1 Tax=Catenulispora acidiphila (strain DSM 44928 / JCM 14897 / NBRC 102108 / NRRL B-24433 / ID139908) TaxID=479433 RepID=C7PYG8_CATAD|nr:GlsB/YeaQ/YmgE family stress response membrane protein [Catenulispora acidiphila]ACU75458.1 Transglycosylase-associated protein [Catenulispora acidiphila DSM 44928]
MGIIAWIVLGLVVGLIADRIMDSPHGLIVTTVVGIAGALLGGWLAQKIFHVDNIRGFFNLSTWLTALVGAIVLLGVLQLVTGSRRGLRH